MGTFTSMIHVQSLSEEMHVFWTSRESENFDYTTCTVTDQVCLLWKGLLAVERAFFFLYKFSILSALTQLNVCI